MGAVRGAAAATAAQALAGLALGTVEARRRWGGWWPRARTAAAGRLRAELLRFLAWTDLGATLGTVTKQLDVVVLGWVAGPAQAGYYRLARSLAGLPGYAVGPLQAAAYPRLARQWAAGDEAGLRRSLSDHARLGALVSSGVLAGVLVAPWVLRLLAGAAYDPAGPAARLLLAGSAVWAGFYWLRPLYMAAGRARAWVVISAASVAASLVAFPPAAHTAGATGVAAVQFFVPLGGHLVAAWLVRGVPRVVDTSAPAVSGVRR